MEENISMETINQLAVKIANLEVQIAIVSAENKVLQNQQVTSQKEEANSESKQ